jgi:putative Mn2+ efflux pump MntP
MKSIFSPWTFNVWELGIFKVSAVSFGIFIGAYFSDFFGNWLITLLILFLIGWIYLAVTRLKYLRKLDK